MSRLKLFVNEPILSRPEEWVFVFLRNKAAYREETVTSRPRHISLNDMDLSTTPEIMGVLGTSTKRAEGAYLAHYAFGLICSKNKKGEI